MRYSKTELDELVMPILHELGFPKQPQQSDDGKFCIGAVRLRKEFYGYSISRIVNAAGGLATIARFSNAAEVVVWCEGACFAMQHRSATTKKNRRTAA